MISLPAAFCYLFYFSQLNQILSIASQKTNSWTSPINPSSESLQKAIIPTITIASAFAKHQPSKKRNAGTKGYLYIISNGFGISDNKQFGAHMQPEQASQNSLFLIQTVFSQGFLYIFLLTIQILFTFGYLHMADHNKAFQQ